MPGAGERLAGQVVRFIDALRREDLEKKPGIAETLDWVAALLDLEVESLAGDPESVRASLVCLLKTESDRAAITPEVLGRNRRPGRRLSRCTRHWKPRCARSVNLDRKEGWRGRKRMIR